MRTIMDERYASKPCQLLDLYLPDENGFDTILWFHGGGMEAGDRKGGAALAEHAVNAGYAFVSVEYSMYPTARYPEFIVDAAQSVKHVQKRLPEVGGSGRIIITGQSAGAYLTMMLCMNPAYLRNFGVDMDGILAFVSDSAQQTVHYNVLRERGMDTRLERLDDAAPLYYAGVNTLTKPLLIIYYENDMPCRPEQNILTYKSLKRFQPEAKVEIVALPGGHCAGSSRVDETGEFPYMRALLKFVKEL